MNTFALGPAYLSQLTPAMAETHMHERRQSVLHFQARKSAHLLPWNASISYTATQIASSAGSNWKRLTLHTKRFPHCSGVE